MERLKRIIAMGLALALVLSMSGCYWEGNTKWRSEQLLLNKLEEKYNEEFIIQQIGVSSARSGGPLVAYCSPKDDKELVFETELYQFGDNISLRDMYIQSIVRREMKQQIDSVLSEYYDNFASEVYVWGLTPNYDSGIRDADIATIVTFTEAMPQENSTSIWIAIDQNEVTEIFDLEHIKTILDAASCEFHLTNAVIDYYIVSDEIINKCNYEITNNYDIMNIVTVLSEGRCKSDTDNYSVMHGYRFLGGSIGLDYVLTVD